MTQKEKSFQQSPHSLRLRFERASQFCGPREISLAFPAKYPAFEPIRRSKRPEAILAHQIWPFQEDGSKQVEIAGAWNGVRDKAWHDLY